MLCYNIYIFIFNTDSVLNRLHDEARWPPFWISFKIGVFEEGLKLIKIFSAKPV